MLTTPFLTDLEPRARIKGSRDPLGVQPIWTRFGRQVVGNLTTVTNSVRDFVVLLLGCHFAERVADEEGPGTELTTFLKWEQLAAYARAAAGRDYAFRGTERVRKNLAESSRVVLSDEGAYQILGNQKIYGLWGLYTAAARESGLLEGDPPRPTAQTRELLDRVYFPRFASAGLSEGRRIVELLRKSPRVPIDVEGTEKPLVRAVARVLPEEGVRREFETDFYRSRLLHGGPFDTTAGRQRRLADLLDRTAGDEAFVWSRGSVAALAREAARQGKDGEGLAFHLHRIVTCESVLAPVTRLFSYVLALEGRPLDFVVSRVRDAWGRKVPGIAVDDVRELGSALSPDDPATADRWVNVAAAASSGDFGGLIELLVEQNRVVMQARGGAPWVELRDGRLVVKFRDEQGFLPDRSELAELWWFPYFLDSVRSIALALPAD